MHQRIPSQHVLAAKQQQQIATELPPFLAMLRSSQKAACSLKRTALDIHVHESTDQCNMMPQQLLQRYIIMAFFLLEGCPYTALGSSPSHSLLKNVFKNGRAF